MTSMLRPVLALCLVGFFSYSSAQEISTTGNLINNGSWSGATYGADPGGCCASISGSGALYDTSTNTIMFSYGLDTVIQIVGLQQALGGTGVQVHGYNYSLDYRLMPNNATHTDNLTASIWLTTSSGFNTEATHLFLSGQVSSGVNDQWNSISGTRNFELPYTDPQSITMRLEGRDGGFWAGYYGPEVRNVSLSVNYSFDPCSSDPLYSSSCPGYWDAFLAQIGMTLFGALAEDTGTIDYTLAPAQGSSLSLSVANDSTRSEPVVDAGGIEISTLGELTVPDGIPEVVREETREKKTIDANLLGSILERARDDSEALAVANRSQQDSISDAANPDFTGRGIDTNGDVVETDLIVSLLRGVATNAGSAAEASDSTSGETVTGVAADTGAVTATVAESASTTDTMSDSVAEPPRRQAETNEAAGGVDIAVLAQQPIGFDQYLTQALSDARFYQEREMYPGQQTVDNRRAQRLLSGANDRVHQSMVDQQYRRP